MRKDSERQKLVQCAPAKLEPFPSFFLPNEDLAPWKNVYCRSQEEAHRILGDLYGSRQLKRTVKKVQFD